MTSFLQNCRKNGDPFVNLLSITPIHDARGKLTHYVGIQSDITELVNHKKAELAARHAALQVIHVNVMRWVKIMLTSVMCMNMLCSVFGLRWHCELHKAAGELHTRAEQHDTHYCR
jgi:hypothetical protein